MTLEIREIPLGGDLKQFLDVVDYIYRDDPNYVRPLDMDIKHRLSRKNPFFAHAEGAIFTAHRNNFCVGRITAQIDREHLARHRDDTGFFGFLDTIDDPSVAEALLARARQFCADRGMKRIRGPLSLSINDETGCLVEGFDTPPMVMMPHHRAYQGGLIAAAGFERTKTLFAWRYEVGNLKRRVSKALEDIEALPEVTSRTVNMKNVEGDTRIVMDIFNDAWSENWGFVPYTEAELAKLASDFKLIIRPEITRIAFINGEPAAVAVALPNVNEAIRDLKGKLFPLGLPKLLFRLKVQRPETARLLILGIRKKFRNERKYAGLSAYLYALLNNAGQELGIRWGELSWTYEENGPVNAAIKMMGGHIYKKYAVYERDV
ncbi:MAG: hypothetical protein RJA70_694 [Pseudomonadota bacterium]|jgi:hypothetical protein